jgi:anti-sigma regulatory factor (Ser/Thr protein kinase)
MAHARIGELAMLPTATAPGHARRWLHEALATVELDDDTVQSVVLVVDELVTNAVIHAGTPIDVRVQHDAGIVHCVVSDRQTDGPLPRIIETADGRGRGLRLVDVVARRWGVDRDTAGTDVWAEIGR